VAVFFGDGAIDEGAFWESLNSACVMKLPVLFVCEDNGYAVHSPAKERHGYKSITDIVEKFDCDVFREQSTDVEVLYQLTLRAAESVRKADRPAFLHLKYYRYLEHVGVNEDFNQGYRSRDEFIEWSKIDPLQIARAKLLAWLPEKELVAMESEVNAQVAGSIRKAVEAPFPSGEGLYEDVFA
jgi:TPP-dependent pyruvate/acetoin dehydrogenase alpha subunit